MANFPRRQGCDHNVAGFSVKFLSEHRDLAKKIAAANEELTQWIQANPEEAQKILMAELKEETKPISRRNGRAGWKRIKFTTEVPRDLSKAVRTEGRRLSQGLHRHLKLVRDSLMRRAKAGFIRQKELEVIAPSKLSIETSRRAFTTATGPCTRSTGEPQGRRRRIRLSGRPERLRQIDAAQHHRGPGEAGQRDGPGRGKPITGPGRDRLVMFQEVRAFPVARCARQRALWPEAEAGPDEQGPPAKWREYYLELVGLRRFGTRTSTNFPAA